MSANPAFAATPRAASASISTANTNRDGTGTIGTVFAAGSSGSKIERVRVKATGTTTAGMVRLFLHDGTNFWLFDEFLVAALTPSATVASWLYDSSYRDLVLPTSWTLRASTHNAETFLVQAFGGDF